jgi:Flp pilus assembly protein TadG
VRAEQGQTLVEFALILPILLLLVLGIFDFGSAFNSKNDLNFLANTAARYGEVNACAPCGSQTIADYVASTADTSQLGNSTTISFCLPGGASKNAVGDPLQVSASAPFNWLGVNLPGLPKGGSATLTSTVTVRILTSPTDPKLFALPLPGC